MNLEKDNPTEKAGTSIAEVILRAGSLPDVDPQRYALILDFDGTLVDFAEHPNRVCVPHRLKNVLSLLNQSFGGAVAILTGRSLASLDAVLESSVDTIGCHGAQWRVKKVLTSPFSVSTDDIKEVCEQLLPLASQYRLLLENKIYSAALHFRGSEHLEPLVDQWITDCLRDKQGLKVIAGKCVREIQVTGINKGRAIERIMKHAAYIGRKPIYLGDDRTDEDAFKWVNQVAGLSVKVGTGSSVARYKLDNHQAVIDWLDTLTTPEKLYACKTI